jgi:hypothetical protein
LANNLYFIFKAPQLFITNNLFKMIRAILQTPETTSDSGVMDDNIKAQPLDIKISAMPSLITRALAQGLLLLVIANIAVCLPYLNTVGAIHGIARVLSLDGERNIPTAYNVFLLLAVAVLLAFITFTIKKETGRFSWHWAILCFGFTYMSMDEAWTIHEDTIAPMRQLLGYQANSEHMGLLHYAWIIPGIGVVLLVGIFYLRFLFRLPRKTMISFIIAGIVYVFGAIGMEALDGAYGEVHGNNFIYKMLTTLEETLEMTGLIMFIHALLVYISEHYKSVTVKFRK